LNPHLAVLEAAALPLYYLRIKNQLLTTKFISVGTGSILRLVQRRPRAIPGTSTK
jgi:hypothetical protein